MKLGIKDMADEIEGDKDSVLDLLQEVIGMVGVDEKTKNQIIDDAVDMAAQKNMEQTIVFMGKAMKAVGREDEDFLLDVARVVAKMHELVFINMLSRLDDDTPDEILDGLLENLNGLISVRLEDGVTVRELHNDIRKGVKDAVKKG